MGCYKYSLNKNIGVFFCLVFNLLILNGCNYSYVIMNDKTLEDQLGYYKGDNLFDQKDFENYYNENINNNQYYYIKEYLSNWSGPDADYLVLKNSNLNPYYPLKIIITRPDNNLDYAEIDVFLNSDVKTDRIMILFEPKEKIALETILYKDSDIWLQELENQQYKIMFRGSITIPDLDM